MVYFYVEYDDDIPFIPMHCRYENNDNCDVMHSIFDDNTASGDGGAMYM